MKRNLKWIAALTLAVMFLATSITVAVGRTLANRTPEDYVPYSYGKAVPAGWCFYHGYISHQGTDNPYVCTLCEYE